MIYLTSDPHFCHNRAFLYGPRGYNTIEEMNEGIITNWNNLITNEDDVYILGDIILSDIDEGLRCLGRLNGQLHIIRGNHDTENKLPRYFEVPNVKSIQEAKYLKYQGYHFYLNHYPTMCSTMNCDRSLKKQLIDLCGHSHTKDRFAHMDKGLIYHCEFDAHDNKPILIDHIIEDLQEWKEAHSVQGQEQEDI